LGQAAPLLATDLARPPDGTLGEWFDGAGGARLRAALAPAAGPTRGSVVLSGGRTEPIEKYYEVAGELAARGFTVLMHDWRGQGLSQRLLSEPMKGHARGASEFIADYGALLDAFEARLPKPWIALGHSMGGCLTALALARGEARFAAAALSAPMFGVLTKPLPLALTRALAVGLTALGGGGLATPGDLRAPPAAFEANILTHDPDRYARNVGLVSQHPELGLGPPTWGWVDFAFAAMGELATGPGLAKVAIPVTALVAEKDAIVDNGALRTTMARLPVGHCADAPGAHHEILQETDAIRAVFWREFDALAARVALA
jgi:lysophospholipase